MLDYIFVSSIVHGALINTMSDDEDNQDGAKATSKKVDMMQQQMIDMQKMMIEQMKTIQLQAQLMQQAPLQPLAISSNVVRQVKVPEGSYNMSVAEFRTFRKDCMDYKILTHYTNQQVVLQMRLNMDSDLKRAVDTNYRDTWDNFTVEEAIKAVGTIVNEVSNPSVYRK